VLPPIAKLTPAQAMYHFLSGYTAKVAGTEKGLGKEPQPNSRPASARRSCRVIRPNTAICCATDQAAQVDCWLVNTGWTGGIFGVGRRMPIKATRALLTGALDGTLHVLQAAQPQAAE
jgi:phosphoenolpyruvate carboxykinase (ATP)